MKDYRKQEEPRTSALEIIAFVVVTSSALVFITVITFATALAIGV